MATRKASYWRKMALIYLIVIIAVIFALFPIYWMIRSSLTPNKIMYEVNPAIIPRQLTLNHYKELFTETTFMRYFKNSLYVATLTTLISIVISVLASYSLTRLRFRFRTLVSRSIILSYLLPAAVLFIPMHVLISRLGFIDTKNALLIVYPTFTIPYCCYMLISYFRTIPASIEEAALIDGCSYLQVLWKIILPIAAPGIAVVMTFSFTLAWKEFLYALVLTTSPSEQTVTIGIASFRFSDQYIWGLLMSSSVIASIPTMFLYLLSQKFMIGGLTAGSVKS